jgi:hypothetical protein
MICEERNFGKFFRPERKRLAGRSENALVTKTGAPLLESIPGECPLWGGGGDR